MKKFEEKEIKEKDDFAQGQIWVINRIYNFLFFEKGTAMDFILKPNKYNFSVPNFNLLGDDLVYQIEATPKGRSKYSATLYINPNDFALVRVDFRNIKTIYKIKLLGVFVDIYLREGKMILSKFDNEKYGLSFAKINFGQRLSLIHISEPTRH